MTIASKEAYQYVLPKMPKRKGAVYDIFVKYSPGGGLTLKELQAVLGWPMNCVSPRVYELADSGFIKDSGYVRGGQTVWVPADPSERQALIVSREAMKGKNAEIVATTFFGHPSPTTYLTIKIPGHYTKYGKGARIKL